MSVRKRVWKTDGGEERSRLTWCSIARRNLTHVASARRHVKTFAKKKDAEKFQAQVRVDVGKGVHVPDRGIDHARKGW